MTTGYTAKLVDSGQTFEEFVLTCARAFGACIEMRDESLDTPIPEKFQPNKYHANALAESEEHLARLIKMTNAERIALGETHKIKAVNDAKASLVRITDENKRIDNMAAQVKKWAPPTPDHIELKEFMIQQLTTSRHDDAWSKKQLAEAKKQKPVHYFNTDLSSAEWSIEYHKKHLQKDEARATDRTEWIQQLRKSLK